MKAIVYSAKKTEKDTLIDACAGKHELSWQSLRLSLETAHFAAGNQAVVVFTSDDVSSPVVEKLAELGVKYILTRSAGTDHIDFNSAQKHQILVKNIPNYSPFAVAEHTVALVLALNRHLITAVENCKINDFRVDNLTGFNLHGRTVGLIGLGHIGQTVATIFKGFGCRVIGYDINPQLIDFELDTVDLPDLLGQSDIISLHVPLSPNTHYMIDTSSIALMKDEVMLVNTSRGGLVNTTAVLNALDEGKIAFYGADVYEFERGIFFENHEKDQVRDELLTRLITHPKVLLTPHQAFLTVEALRDIAKYTIEGLDEWEKQLVSSASFTVE